MDTPLQQEQRKLLYQAIGRTLNNWARLEAALSNLFWVGTLSNNRSMGHAVFNAVISMEAKLKITAVALSKTADSPAIQYLVKKTLADVSKLNKKRNEIAHSCVRKVGEKVFVNPYFALHDNPNDNKLFTLPDLIRRQVEISHLENSLMWLKEACLMVQGRLSKFEEPIRGPIWKYLPHTDLSSGEPPPQPQSSPE